MRYKKREILDTVNLLIRVNQTIQKSEKMQASERMSMLEDCQNAAIEAGTYLETLGECVQPIVKLFEDYCEKVYQQSLHPVNTKAGRRIAGEIDVQLKQISYAVKYQLPAVKKEIVFLPYKASMWDSLESVWMAASQDKSCSVYVIPVPYYDKNPDGSPGRMHYEGDMYPDYVPVTDFHEYSLKERRPDVIFIHNPYDECNYVTSVHPDFYASELKKYTDLLVYIPYFIGINGRVEEHFCTTPGVFYADRVIVESEPVKKIYIEALEKLEREIGRRNLFENLNDKIVALGSPKMDRICNAKQKDIKLPEKWKRLVYENNGKKKKIIFYNTTVTGLLKNSDRMLAKLEKVFRQFETETKVVLWWRPHPLLLSTIQSMREELYEDYVKLTEWYKEKGFGIYDDTEDPGMAVLFSDAYYGDRSSVMELYKATGKPILIQRYGE